jgi:ABC-2 type transport system ATP-binding protein
MVVEIKDLNKRYGSRLAVDNLSLKIRKGEILGLLGPNGAGKTTLINSIIGITQVQSGEVYIFGRNMIGNGMDIKRRIGVVPQNIALINEFTAMENVAYFVRLYGLKGQALKDGVREALEFTNLWERRREYPKKFSGGMQRRLNIACSIAHQPELIIMDEPTVGIDPQSRNHILESVRILRDRGATVIYTSHYMEEVEAVCTRVAIMDNGRLIAEGTKETLAEYVKEEQVAEIELGNAGFTITQSVKAIRGVKECSLAGNTLTVVLDRSCNISRVLTVIADNGGSINRVNMQEATLEAVFLALTGKKLRD